MTWMASITGQPMELLAPRVEEVDFRAMADALSHLNRYGGHAAKPISVAQHLIIGCDAAPEVLRPWWLLHDAHEERTGDVISPVKEAYGAIAFQTFGPEAARIIEEVRKEFEKRHDAVIHKAAGLLLPTDAQKREIKRIDLIALATEKRDFHVEQRREWFVDKLSEVRPSRNVYRWRPPVVVADELYRRFKLYLPALTRRVA